jgi:hypothetical protein
LLESLTKDKVLRGLAGRFGWLASWMDHLTNQKREEKIACLQKSRFNQQLSQTELRF